MLEGPRAGLTQLLQDIRVDIRELYQGYRGNIAEYLFQHIDQNVTKHEQDKVDAEIEHHHPVYLLQVSLLIEYHPEIGQRVGEKYEEHAAEQLRALRQLAQTKGYHHPRHDLKHQKLMRERHHQRAYQHRYEMGEQRRPRIEERADDYRNNGVRQDIHVEQVVRYAELCQYRAAKDATEQEEYILLVP